MGYSSDGTYLVIAPGVVRPNLPYAVSAHIIKSQEVDHIIRVEVSDSRVFSFSKRNVKCRSAPPRTTLSVDER